MVPMSMKRTKQTTRGRSKDSDSENPLFRKPPEKTYTWAEDVNGQPDSAFVPYSLTQRFARGALLQHPTFGRGVVSAVENSLIVVLFEAGAKKLGHKV